ncbi:jg10618 [Pararge aegeria aegeria]|uniref:Jg10618 protein n=1 Tax=Pararge aegeria aegeria TaxID=348720 RepID=A0A8S4R9W7_9NEOP|nr:jg10618 [Pararge aegeria aegeria]
MATSLSHYEHCQPSGYVVTSLLVFNYFFAAKFVKINEVELSTAGGWGIEREARSIERSGSCQNGHDKNKYSKEDTGKAEQITWERIYRKLESV